MNLRSFSLPALLLASTLVLTGCDSGPNEAPSNETLTGRWVATTAFDHDRTWPLPEWASQDSVRYVFSGTQIITLTLDDRAGAVTGTIDWDEAGTLTVTTYRDGAITNNTPGPITQDETDAVRASYVAPTLTFEPFSNALISTQLETGEGVPKNFEMTFDEDRGQAAYTYRLIETAFTGPNGEQVSVGVTLPVALTFERMPRSAH